MEQVASNRRSTFHINSLQTKLTSFVVRRRRNSSILKSIDAKLSTSCSSLVSQISLSALPFVGDSGSPCPCAEMARLPLDTILRDANFILEFRHFLKSELSQENLDFWLAVESFKNHAKKPRNKCKMLMEAKKIYRKYVAPGALCEINLDIGHSRAIAGRLNLSEINPAVFDAAQKEVYLLIKRDSFPRFKNAMAKANV